MKLKLPRRPTLLHRPSRNGSLGRLAAAGGVAIELLIRLCGWSAILFVFAIFFFVFREAAPLLFGKLNLVEFFTSTDWQPSSDVRPAVRHPGAAGRHAVGHGAGDGDGRAAGAGSGGVHLRVLRGAASRKRSRS